MFSETYAQNRWGGAPGEFYSGVGSTEENTRDYCEFIAEVIAHHPSERPTVVDLGCGDFRVGSALVGPGVHYVGVDVVPELIERNRERFGGSGVEFVAADIVNDELPSGDICLVREVMQHLSNAEIQRILEQTRRYEQVFITNHYMANEGDLTPNADKPHGPDLRGSDGSGVYLDQSPFNVDGLELVLTTRHSQHGEIRTFRLTYPGS